MRTQREALAPPISCPWSKVITSKMSAAGIKSWESLPMSLKFNR